LRKLLIASAVCDLLVVGISFAKTVADAVDALRACRRHVMVLRAALRAKTSGRTLLVVLETPALNELELDDVVAVVVEKERPICDDDPFLSFAAGSASEPHCEADGSGIVTAKETTVCDGNDLVRLYDQ
jgi:hypothetical protein